MPTEYYKSVGISLPSFQSFHVVPQFGDMALGHATAFFVQKSKQLFLVTNRHVVTGRHPVTGQTLHSKGAVPDRLTVYLPTQYSNEGRTGLSWSPVTFPLNADGKPAWTEHPELGANADFVVFPTVINGDYSIHPYVLEDNHADLRLGPLEQVSVVGFPFGRSGGAKFAIWSSGFVATEPDVNFEGQPVFLIDCRSRPGQSGSPVIIWRTGSMVQADGSLVMFEGVVSKLLGIYSGRINSESDLGTVWKVSAVESLLDALIQRTHSCVLLELS